jgi:hypothetical protein
MKKKASAKIELHQILQTLTSKKIPFVLTGAHAIGGWTGEPRATKDVDILVKPGRNFARAVKAIRELYPHLEMKNFHGVAAFFVPGETKSVIDVTYPHRPDIEATLATPLWVEEGDLRYRIPYLEAALANKYGAMITLNRNPLKRQQDAVDFGKMVRHSLEKGQQTIDPKKLRALGEKVWSGGGGDEILRLVEEIKQGRIVDVNALLKGQEEALPSPFRRSQKTIEMPFENLLYPSST